MRQRLPPLNALKAFEAAARHESFTRAAAELFVTQGAVSHQVKALETELGVKLFNRERQRLVLTEAGRDYLVVVRDALDRIALGTERLLQRQNAGVLTVSTSPDFAAKWLVHRLGNFAEAHPGDRPARVGDPASCRLRARGGRPGGAPRRRQLAGTRHRATEHRAAVRGVQSEAAVAAGAASASPSDILKYPLIHMDSRADWTRWLQAAGLDDADAIHGPVLNRASMVIDAAINGQGDRARAHDARRLGSHQRAAGAALSRRRCGCRRPTGSSARRRPRRCRRS